MNRLNKSVKIDPRFAWTDWQLYDMPSSPKAAVVLNELLRDLVNHGCDRNEVSRQMACTMDSQSFREVGACDSEPLRFLDQVLDEIYGED